MRLQGNVIEMYNGSRKSKYAPFFCIFCLKNMLSVLQLNLIRPINHVKMERDFTNIVI